MTKDFYIYSISRATAPDEIQDLGEEANGDDTLFITEKEEIAQAASDRFAELNAATKPNHKGRW